MHLGQFLRQLTRLAEEFGIAVVITNQVCLLACMYVHVCMYVYMYMSPSPSYYHVQCSVKVYRIYSTYMLHTVCTYCTYNYIYKAYI